MAHGVAASSGIVALIAVVVGASAPALGASSVDATLTIHHRVCPAGYAGPDFYGVCHDDPVVGMPFTIAGMSPTDEAETSADGNADFGNLLPGAHEVRGGTPDGVARSAVFCTPAAAPGTGFPFTRSDTAGIEIDLAAGDHVVCDWYVVPWAREAEATPLAAPGWPEAGDATLTVYGVLCPEGYARNDHVAACSGTPAAGARFQAKQTGSWTKLPAVGSYAVADEGGVIRFALGPMAPGPVRLSALIPDDVPVGGGFTVPRVSCTADDGRRVLDAMPLESRATGPVFEIRVVAGDRVRCDAYFLPLPPA